MTDSGFGRGPVPGRPAAQERTEQPQKPGRAGLPPARLEVANGPAIGRSYALERENMLIGRNDPPALVVDVDLTDAELAATPVISRRHAELSWIEDELYLRDLGSTNGTLLNGQDITRREGQPHAPAQRLKDGDRLLLANIELVLRLG